MELYYKNLISEEASLEKLVDDLMLVVQGADALVEAAGAKLAPERRAEIATRLGRLKESCRRVKRQAIQSALKQTSAPISVFLPRVCFLR